MEAHSAHTTLPLRCHHDARNGVIRAAYRMHTPAPDAEPGPHESNRVVPQPPVPPEMEPLVPEPQPEKPVHPPKDLPGEKGLTSRLV
jgi:hypothetical protein